MGSDAGRQRRVLNNARFGTGLLSLEQDKGVGARCHRLAYLNAFGWGVACQVLVWPCMRTLAAAMRIKAEPCALWLTIVHIVYVLELCRCLYCLVHSQLTRVLYQLGQVTKLYLPNEGSLAVSISTECSFQAVFLLRKCNFISSYRFEPLHGDNYFSWMINFCLT